MALVQAVGQGLTFTALLIFVVSNLNPARAIAFVAYIQVLRLDVIEVATTAMTTWLRVRQQIHSNLTGLYVSMQVHEASILLTQSQNTSVCTLSYPHPLRASSRPSQ